jgi:hypothetical protein
MLIIVVVESLADRESANEVLQTIQKELTDIPVGIASAEDVRQEDIVGYLHWKSRKED